MVFQRRGMCQYNVSGVLIVKIPIILAGPSPTGGYNLYVAPLPSVKYT
jgi:hypothetical protein